ncbi:MAG: hypothetical protein M0R77_02140 [Gammaproteobacteria bacterium]|nr:hypothetical protein [Gammaproteobacteria bacterium]
MSRVVVRAFDSARVTRLVILAVVGVLVAGWGLFDYGRYRAGVDFTSANKEAARLTEVNRQHEKTIGELREAQAVLERSKQIEREAYKQLETAVAGLQDEIAELNGELAFYRGIVTPKEAAAGLRVQAFDLTPNGLERGYRYKLVLTQVLKNDRVASGRVTVAIEGNQDGRISVLDLNDLVTEDARQLTYRFKYFQNFEGNLALPEGFTPVRTTVKVVPREQRHQGLERVFDWPAA